MSSSAHNYVNYWTSSEETISAKWLTFYLLIIPQSLCQTGKGTNQTVNWVTPASYPTVETISGLLF